MADPAAPPIVPCPDCGRNVVTYVARRGQNAGGRKAMQRIWPILKEEKLLWVKSVRVRYRVGKLSKLKLCRLTTASRCSKMGRRRRRRLHRLLVQSQDICSRQLQLPVGRV
ncbi:uncharacterized protein LOC125537960 [Triticum urartu]|uniref:uncharacterized protein LOC125537960 n=1 Tax=Triticum urartu TaxID=4572 RepID=UPI002043A00C|nr:uncharacterized protein LOC125537960 [Triticum urartu]